MKNYTNINDLSDRIKSAKAEVAIALAFAEERLVIIADEIENIYLVDDLTKGLISSSFMDELLDTRLSSAMKERKLLKGRILRLRDLLR